MSPSDREWLLCAMVVAVCVGHAISCMTLDFLHALGCAFGRLMLRLRRDSSN